MARARSPDREKARKIYLKAKGNVKLTDIAKELGVGDSQIRKWKSQDKWDDELQTKGKGALPKAKGNVTKKRGAPVGNKNAIGNRGGAAPLRNTNAEKHGAFSRIYWDTLEDDEMEMISEIGEDAEEELVLQIQMFAIRERRLMQRIKRYKETDEKNHGLSVKSVSKKKVIEDLEDSEGNSLNCKKSTETTVTNTEAVMNSNMALEAELTKVQRAKTKAIDSLAKLRNEREKLEIEESREQREADLHELQKELLDAQIEHMDAQTNKLLGTDTDLEDTSETDDMIYNSDGGDSDEE